ncbi:hypothetical protein GGC64_005589 [Mycobacterium sp. OAS707]|uniref:hypothetical protein n=1 Tax=Mycobacterium sp. OAS707 TaxID=2663822 RepID=UPI001789E8C1|nr:hypothetical protein [Mycobacterium sp. OAS707]MBE1551529.1 hypothetical protein [Mycobacterium sp. OAS707]
MENAKRIGWVLAVALGIGLAAANTPAVASAAPGDSGKGSAGESAQSSDAPSGKKDAPNPRRHPPKHAAEAAVTPKKSGSDLRKGGTTSRPVVTSAAAASAPRTPSAPLKTVAALTALAAARREFEPAPAAQPVKPAATTSAVDPDFITSTHGFFGLFSVTSAADPDDNHFVAFVLRTPFFTNVLTSGTDPEDNLGFGAASTGVAGHTVNTFMSPFLNFSVAIPVEDPFAELFTALVRAGF